MPLLRSGLFTLLLAPVLGAALLPTVGAGTGGCIDIPDGLACYGDYHFGDCSTPGGYERTGTGLYAKHGRSTVTTGGYESCLRHPHEENYTYHERGVETMVLVLRPADETVPVTAGTVVYYGDKWERTEWDGRTWGPTCYHEQGAAIPLFGGISGGPCRTPPPDYEWGHMLP